MTGSHKSNTFVGTLTPPPRVLIIAGSDSGGGAGIQADIKTVTMMGGYAMTAITAITAQNTLGVEAVMAVPADMLRKQIEAVVLDLGCDAVKIGMIGSVESAGIVAEFLEQTHGAPVVFDPVMVASSGAALADSETIAVFRRLMRLSHLATPNLPELAALTGLPVESEEGRIAAARALAQETGCAILAKGGHGTASFVVDLLVGADGELCRWQDARIETPHTHGTGCTLASAIAVGLGRGRAMADAVERARGFVRTAMRAAPGFGAGHGPMGHHAATSGEIDLNQVTLPAADYDTSVAFYRTLGLTQIVDSPGLYARFECPGGGTLSLHLDAGGRIGDATIYLESFDLDAWVTRLRAAGIAFETLPADQEWGWREAHLRDPAGNRLCLYRAGENRRFPPWRIGE